jgi:hypothetical protein
MTTENKLHASAIVRTMPNWMGLSTKTLWDWLLFLAVLTTPIVLILALIWMSIEGNQTAIIVGQTFGQQRYRADIQLGQQQQQDAVLDTYLDRMSTLMLNNNLSSSGSSDVVRKVARDQTIAVLLRLDGVHRGYVLQFLYQSDLITKGDVKVSLSGANLSGAKLHGAKLEQADLSGADLSGADLSGADLTGVLLNGTKLAGATMPDGSVNP